MSDLQMIRAEWASILAREASAHCEIARWQCRAGGVLRESAKSTLQNQLFHDGGEALNWSDGILFHCTMDNRLRVIWSQQLEHHCTAVQLFAESCFCLKSLVHLIQTKNVNGKFCIVYLWFLMKQNEPFAGKVKKCSFLMDAMRLMMKLLNDVRNL